MKFILSWLTTTALALLLIVPASLSAHSADKGGPTVADYMEPTNRAHMWTGFNAGLHAGYSWKHSDIGVGGINILGAQSSDFVGGGHIGYDVRLGNTVIGIMGDYTAGSAGMFGGAYKVKDSWTLAARGGFLLNDRLLAYALAGHTWSNTSSAFGSVPDLSGWTVGGGVEWAMFDRASLRLEYRMTDYGRETVAAPITVENVDHSVRLGVTWKMFSF